MKTAKHYYLLGLVQIQHGICHTMKYQSMLKRNEIQIQYGGI